MALNPLRNLDVDTKVAPFPCPQCGEHQDAFASDCVPEPGDIGLCFKCGAATILTEDGRRVPTLMESLEIDGDPEIIRMRQLLRTANAKVRAQKRHAGSKES